MTQFSLRGYQKDAIAWGREHPAGFFAIDMGLGKTAILAHLMDKGTPTLVVAPLRVTLLTWPDELATWRPDLSFKVLYGKTKQLDTEHDVYLINYEGIKWLSQWQPEYARFFYGGMLVLDESPYIKSPDSMRFKYLKQIAPLFKRRYCLSATPVGNSVQGLWSQYYPVDFGAALGKNITAFRKEYCEPHPRVNYVFVDKPFSASVIAKKVAPVTFRLEAGAHSYEQNKAVYTTTKIELPTKSMTVYKKLLKDLIAEVGDVTIEAGSRAVATMKVRQLLQGIVYDENKNHVIDNTVKLDALEERILSLNGAPCIVCIQFKSELDAIRNRFQRATFFTHSNSIDLLRDWNAGKVPVLVVHPRSCSHGLNLQHGGHHLIWLGLEWSLDTYLQTNGRIIRSGQKYTCTIDHIVAKDTIDEMILAALKNHELNQKNFLELLNGSYN